MLLNYPFSKRIFLSAFLAMVLSFINISDAYALSCMRQGPLGLIWDTRSAKFVFEGYVQSVGEPKILEPFLIEHESGDFQFTRMPEIEDHYPDAKPYQVEVSRVWRGPVASDKVRVYAGGLWQHDIEVGQNYFFLINTEGKDGFYLGGCSPSTYSLSWGRVIFFSNVILYLIAGLIILGIVSLIRRKARQDESK